MGDFTGDTRQFSQALKQYQQATKKEVPDILNMAGRNIAFRAAQFTPKANPTVIQEYVKRDPHLAYALTSIALRGSSRSSSTRTHFGSGILPAPAFREAVAYFISSRKSSVGFLRSGWAAAIEKLGGTFRGRKVGKGHGWASKASMTRFVTTIVNTVPGIDKIGKDAMQRAIDFVAVDMINHAQTVFQKSAKKHSS